MPSANEIQTLKQRMCKIAPLPAEWYNCLVHKNPQRLTLNDGREIPQVGFGLLRIPEEETAGVVEQAFEAGYRHFDSAAAYNNEGAVGSALSGILNSGKATREELWITSKVRDSEQGFDSTLRAAENTLRDLGLDYLDMYMIHWPVPAQDKYLDTWRAFERLQSEGLVKTLGVCNFLEPYLQRLLENCNIPPAVNQLELHPSFQQVSAVEFTLQNNIAVESYSPLGRGQDLEEPVILDLAEKFNKSPAQIILRYHLQRGFITIPKSATPSRMAENLDLFGFSLSADEVAAINALDRADGSMGHDPRTYSYA